MTEETPPDLDPEELETEEEHLNDDVADGDPVPEEQPLQTPIPGWLPLGGD